MSNANLPLYSRHERKFHQNRFVYPVLSRRSKGLSLGINLNPDKICNFDCIYCQVDRRSESETRFVEIDEMLVELEHLLTLIRSGEIYEDEKFSDVPMHLRRLNDIAFSGDGEPTTYKNFDEIVRRVVDVKTRSLGPKHNSENATFDETKLVLITNASMFHRPVVQQGLNLLDENNGEIWAKLDAGTDEYYQQIERTKIPFQRILDNIRTASLQRPIVIQSLFMRVDDVPPSEFEISEYCNRLNEFTEAGGQLKLVQIYTVARQPAESHVASLTDAEVNAIAQTVRAATKLTVESYYGNWNANG